MTWSYTRFGHSQAPRYALVRDGKEVGTVSFLDVDHASLRVRRIVAAMNELDGQIADDSLVVDPESLRLVPRGS